MRGRPLNLVGKTTVGQLAAVLRRCDLLVGNDGGVMHIATAVDTPVVAVFGPTNHRAWGPYGHREWPRPGDAGPDPQAEHTPSPRQWGAPDPQGEQTPCPRQWKGGQGVRLPPVHLVVRGDPPCEPCMYIGNVSGDPRACAARDCMRRIEPAEVVAAAEWQLDRADSAGS
jgi:ADP-heptose:LPS heptosyltransferase